MAEHPGTGFGDNKSETGRTLARFVFIRGSFVDCSGGRLLMGGQDSKSLLQTTQLLVNLAKASPTLNYK